MYNITIYPGTLAPWCSQVYGGLYNLSKANKANISISTQLGRRELIDGTALRVDIEDSASKKKRSVIFELADGGSLSVPVLLDWRDYIVKRSLNRQRVSDLPEETRDKVIPYGINFNCSSQEVPFLRLFFLHHAIRLKLLGKHDTRIRKHGFKIQYQVRFLMYMFKNNLSLFEQDFEASPYSPTKYRVFYLTRLFEDRKKPGNITQFSRARIELVRLLKKEFQDSFFGGIVKTPLSKRHCSSDLLFKKISRREFGQKLRQADISVCTLGVNRSNPWKLGESIAASRCIVSEPLFFELPTPLEEGVHLRTFNSNEDCVRVCRELIENPGAMKRMKEEVHQYYLNHVKSSRLLENLFEEMFRAKTHTDGTDHTTRHETQESPISVKPANVAYAARHGERSEGA